MRESFRGTGGRKGMKIVVQLYFNQSVKYKLKEKRTEEFRNILKIRNILIH